MKDFFNLTIIQLGDFTIKASSILTFAVFVVFIVIFLQLVKKTIYKTHIIDLAKKFTIYRLIKYCALLFSSVIGLQILGFNLSVLVAGSAALLVGVGLGLQNLFSDFISGIILLIDSSVKVGDIIELNGLVCKVQEINLRTTTVLTRSDTYIILPNSELTRSQLINWTHNAIASRFVVTVGVDYSSDVNLVMKTLQKAVEKKEGVLTSPPPFVRFTDFGESSLNFSLIFWSEEVFGVENIKSDLRVIIFNLLKENNITIPFPQRVIHIQKET
ncbi:MAG: mechanosensitive ion channel [Bacteroidetes bacterium]|nr:mechanosensitive ion channel [Bacteroidota bacterium]